jgi:hypothetical protein
MLKGLDNDKYDNIIDEYLFCNLLSLYLFNYNVHFINYYTNFNKIDYKDNNIIGIIVNAHQYKLYLFVCDSQEYCYNYKTKEIKYFEWKNRLNSDKLYVAQGVILNEHEIQEYIKLGIYIIKVLYITIIRKPYAFSDNDVYKNAIKVETGVEIFIRGYIIDLKPDIDYNNIIYRLSAVNDVVLEYILSDILYRLTKNSKIKQYIMDKIQYPDIPEFIPTKFLIAIIYKDLYSEKSDKQHLDNMKKHILSAAIDDKYPPAIFELCTQSKLYEINDTMREELCATNTSYDITAQTEKQTHICIPNSEGPFKTLDACNQID